MNKRPGERPVKPPADMPADPQVDPLADSPAYQEVNKKASMAILITAGIVIILVYFWMARILLLSYPVKASIRLVMFISLPLLYDRVWLRLSWRKILRRLMPKRRQLRRVLLTLLIGAAGIAAVNLLADPVCRLLGLSDDIRQIVSQTKANQDFLEVVLLYIPLVNALGEELFFRYGLYLGITDLGHARTAMLFSASLFSLYHLSIIASWISLPLLLASLAGLFIAGLFLNHIAHRDRHILGIYLIHGLVNFLIISLSLHYLPY